ncbi:hypothetical protein C2G38_2195511 [Gigaspora rosea]|uniref:Uncharacterized protein n=1 Tax=Gigaspora rosea TaxID=44941 RepID=A0A397UVL8_9GLOM|nr:hypothetical protein C2G38_2195511 [Gigaspora rosea]
MKTLEGNVNTERSEDTKGNEYIEESKEITTKALRAMKRTTPTTQQQHHNNITSDESTMTTTTIPTMTPATTFTTTPTTTPTTAPKLLKRKKINIKQKKQKLTKK